MRTPTSTELERALPAEAAIVWLTDAPPSFVYETTVLAGRPDGPLTRNVGRLVAYAELDRKAYRNAGRRWPRRTWWVPSDRAHRAQHDAVNPASVRVGAPSVPLGQ